MSTFLRGTYLIQKKLNRVKNILKNCAGVVVAFSGGVDSSLLLKIAKNVLSDRVIAVTAVSPIHPQNEVETARKIAQKLRCKHIVMQSHELKNRTFVANPKNRCYYCKMELFTDFKKLAQKYGYHVIEASNKSDLRDYRPGLKAVTKLGIVSPFIQAGINKREIRILAKRYGLPNWDKPSMACLASRIPYGRIIDNKILKRVASAENYLKKLKLTQIRVRDYLPIARIEVLKDDFKTIVKHRTKIISYFKKLGYKYVTLDLEGYQTGSLNR